jgi:hypothetical protein
MSVSNPVLGWREWISFPELGLSSIKAKIDTGARTSCLHAFKLETFDNHGTEWVRFSVHPYQKNQKVIMCEAPVHDKRIVTDSGGHSEERIVIISQAVIGSWIAPIEITLTSRDLMRFRVLLGRTAIKKGGFVVNPALSYQQTNKE